NNPLLANLRQDIIERTDGIPLFVEEMTKAVLEAESEGEARRAAAFVPSPALAVPPTPPPPFVGRRCPARPPQGDGPHPAGGGDRTLVHPSSAGCGRVQPRGQAANGARPSHRGWFAAPAG